LELYQDLYRGSEFRVLSSRYLWRRPGVSLAARAILMTARHRKYLILVAEEGKDFVTMPLACSGLAIKIRCGAMPRDRKVQFTSWFGIIYVAF
jgi:hypothetical protein